VFGGPSGRNLCRAWHNNCNERNSCAGPDYRHNLRKLRCFATQRCAEGRATQRLAIAMSSDALVLPDGSNVVRNRGAGFAALARNRDAPPFGLGRSLCSACGSGAFHGGGMRRWGYGRAERSGHAASCYCYPSGDFDDHDCNHRNDFRRSVTPCSRANAAHTHRELAPCTSFRRRDAIHHLCAIVGN
jgi:hypothetical protein